MIEIPYWVAFVILYVVLLSIWAVLCTISAQRGKIKRYKSNIDSMERMIKIHKDYHCNRLGRLQLMKDEKMSVKKIAKELRDKGYNAKQLSFYPDTIIVTREGRNPISIMYAKDVRGKLTKKIEYQTVKKPQRTGTVASQKIRWFKHGEAHSYITESDIISGTLDLIRFLEGRHIDTDDFPGKLPVDAK